METRQVTQVRLYKLWMKNIDGGLATELVAIAYDKIKLINWHAEQLADEPYQEAGPKGIDGEEIIYTKVYKKGSRLENYQLATNIAEWNKETAIGIDDSWTTQEHIDDYMSKPGVTIFFVDKEQDLVIEK